MKEWNNITLETLIRADRASRSVADPLDKQIAVISIITGMTEDEVLDLPKDRLLKILADYANLKDLTDDKPFKDFKAGGYMWHPQTDVSKFSTSQYIDINELVKDKDRVIEHLADMLAVICEPYKQYPLFIKVKPKMDFKEKRAILLKAKARDVYPIAVFFCRVLIHLTADIAGSLEKKAKEIMRQSVKKTSSGSNGVGT